MSKVDDLKRDDGNIHVIPTELLSRQPANSIHSSSAGSMLGLYRRRWHNIEPTSFEFIVSAQADIINTSASPVITDSVCLNKYVNPMFVQYWTSVAVGGPTLSQH